ncbi:hypothetical protein Tco_0514481 [Tanacetum coccineum]
MLERKKKSRTTGLRRLKKVGMSRRVESSEDQESLGDHEDASKQGRSIEDIDKDAELLEEVLAATIDRYLTEHTDGSRTEQKNQACIFGSIKDVVTKKVNYHLFNGEVELFGFVFLSYLKWLTTFGGSPGPSMPPSSSPGPSKPLSYSPGPSGSAPSIGNAECSNCKFLSENIKVFAGKIKVLEATLEIEMHPENHTLDSTALLHELYNEMGKLGLE